MLLVTLPDVSVGPVEDLPLWREADGAEVAIHNSFCVLIRYNADSHLVVCDKATGINGQMDGTSTCLADSDVDDEFLVALRRERSGCLDMAPWYARSEHRS
jgi:hypothetical protein